MGYTHYWTHRKRFTNAEWQEVCDDLTAIVACGWAEGLTVGTGCGESPLPTASAIVMGDEVIFNGVGDDAHETFHVYQNRRPLDSWQKPSQRGWDFCKTARKPYDVAVTAALCYLETCWDGRFEVSSDGHGHDWQDGLALARRALPEKGNMLDLPFDVRWDDQFDWRKLTKYTETYSLRTRHDGSILVTRNSDPYKVIGFVPADRFEDFVALAERRFRTVPTSAFGEAEVRKLRKAEDRAIRDLLTYPDMMDGAPTDILTQGSA